jgi:starch phosphorylase
MKWNKNALMNIANAGPFSADYTIHRYADEIWKMKPGEKNILLQPEA